MSRFLHGFLEEDILSETSERNVIRQASEKALELAMLGLADEANFIWTLLKRSAHFSEKDISSAMEFFFAESRIHRPCGVPYLEEEDLLRLEKEALENFPHLPLVLDISNVREENYIELLDFVEAMDANFANATTGYDVRRVSFE
jgi:hypothetical protein